jgi:hypothetical protein
MAQEDTLTLTGGYESRLLQLLQAAINQARLAQWGARPRMHDALTELEDLLEHQTAVLANATEHDRSELELAALWDDDGWEEA